MANLTEIGFPEDLVFPDVFANTGNSTTAQSFIDARGNEVLYWDADLQPIVFQEAEGLAVRTVVLRDDGDIVTDLVREEGVPEEGVQETGRHKATDLGELLYLNAALEEVTADHPSLDGVPADQLIPVIVDPTGAVMLKEAKLIRKAETMEDLTRNMVEIDI